MSRKIGIVSTFPPKECGIAPVAEEHYKHLKERDDIEVVSISSSKNADIKVDFSSPLLYRQISRAVEESNIDLMHIHHEFGLYAFHGLEFKLLDVPKVVNIHETAHELPYNWYSLVSRWDSFVQNQLVRSSDRVIVHTRNDLDGFQKKENIRHIPLGSSLKDVERPDKLSTLLYFGFLDKTKNPVNAVRSAEFHDKKIIIAGNSRTKSSGNLEEKLRKESENYSNVEVKIRWIDEEEKDEVFRESDAVLMPYSEQKSGSGVLVDAISYGRPVIASPRPVFVEEIEEHGIGVLAGTSTEDISSGVSELEENFGEKVENMWKYRGERSWKRIIDEYCEIYEEILSPR